jgi:hypothetical protein
MSILLRKFAWMVDAQTLRILPMLYRLALFPGPDNRLQLPISPESETAADPFYCFRLDELSSA